VTVAVVTPWHGHLDLQDGYDRALELGPWPDEVLVVDNGSDPPLGFAAIRNDENLGFCRASNQGLDAATADVVVFLNNDVTATEAGWLETVCDLVEPSVLVGAQLRSDPHCWVDGTVYPYLDGWCLAGLRDDLQEIGGFDTTLEEPAYYSDNLLCLEARHLGFTLREAKVGLIHMVGQTADRNDRAVEAASRANHQRYQERTRALATKGAARNG
jgi:GT2 family glycosyltransferase